jgi:F-type H+-transporting ATPase subunit b
MRLIAILAALAATPALAAPGKPFFSLANTDFVVLLAFLVFIGILVYFKVPGIVTGMLDKRSAGIAAEIEEARSLREEAQALLASYERKQKEVQEQADRIVAQAKSEAEAAAKQAKADLEKSVERRLAAAEDQIAQAEARAVRDVRNKAIEVATAAARQVVAGKMTADAASASIDAGIDTVAAKLH